MRRFLLLTAGLAAMGFASLGVPQETRAQTCGADNPNCIAPTPPTSPCDDSNRIATTAWVSACAAGGAGAVTSVFSRTGAIVANSGDYTIGQITNGLSSALTQYHFFVGDGSTIAADTAMFGDGSFGASGLIVAKTNGVAFAQSATTDTTVASNILSGTLPAGRLAGSYTGITGVGTLTAGATDGGFTIALSASTVTGMLTVPNGGTGAGTFTANLPLIGNGTGAVTQGTRSGNTTNYATATGTLTNGDCVSIDSNGNFVDAGGACTTGGGGGTVASSTIGQVAVYTAATTVTGSANVNVNAGLLSLGQSASVSGQLKLFGDASGSLSIVPQSVAGTPIWTAGTSSGTPAVTASSPLAITTATGNITCSTCITTAGGAATATYPATTTINQLLYSSSANVVAGLATANNGVLITSSGGVPSIGSTLPAAVQGNITALGTVVSGVWNGTAIIGTYIATNTVANSNLAQMASNTWKGNSGGSTANAADNAWTNCNGNNSAVQYTNGTGTGCGANFANLTVADQTLSGGANLTIFSLGSVSSGTTTLDCGKNQNQAMVNTGASTIAAPATANDGNCNIDVTNGSGAGAITLSGFPKSGGSFATTNTASATCTVTIASPGVVTYTAHGLIANQRVYLTTTGALPTGLTAGTIYYLVPTIATNTFELAATPGGTAINTSGSQSGTHTCHVPSVYSLVVTQTLGLAYASWVQTQ